MLLVAVVMYLIGYIGDASIEVRQFLFEEICMEHLREAVGFSE